MCQRFQWRLTADNCVMNIQCLVKGSYRRRKIYPKYMLCSLWLNSLTILFSNLSYDFRRQKLTANFMPIKLIRLAIRFDYIIYLVIRISFAHFNRGGRRKRVSSDCSKFYIESKVIWIVCIDTTDTQRWQ